MKCQQHIHEITILCQCYKSIMVYMQIWTLICALTSEKTFGLEGLRLDASLFIHIFFGMPVVCRPI